MLLSYLRVIFISAYYSPEITLIIDRFWCTIGEMASTMLLHARLVEEIWVEATTYAVNIYN